MKNQLLQKIEQDLGLKRFHLESDCDYYQRMIYSVGGAWVQSLVFGQSFRDSELDSEYQSVDIMYVQSHLAKILEGYLNCFDINLDWIDEAAEGDNMDRASRLSTEIIRVSLKNHNIAQVNSRRLIPLLPQYIRYDEELYVCQGNTEKEENLCMVGTSLWKKDQVNQYKEPYRPIDVDGREYFDIIDKKFRWKRLNLTGEYMAFLYGGRTTFRKSWGNVDINKLAQGIHLLKLASEYNGGYLLIKKNRENYFVADLDPWYIESGEIFRIIYSLNQRNRTPITFRYEDKQDYILLKTFFPLPKSEKELVFAASWPYRTYKDEFYRIIPAFLWDVVKKSLCQMGIKLVEQGGRI